MESVGTTVTLTGIATNGSEPGDVIRYFQDATGGIVAYGTSDLLSSLEAGNSILIIGALSEYNGL